MKKILIYEPFFFLLFGCFHLHRIWALADRVAYANFWLGVLEEKGLFYYTLMGVLALLCLLGIFTFVQNIHHNFWWRWIYLFGGAYVLFDIFAIAADLKFWHQLLLLMFDTSAVYWNVLWSIFILLGAFAFLLGIFLFHQRNQQKKAPL